jgi:leader peptidase (prepilin peptidase)/N-methyltransferase
LWVVSKGKWIGFGDIEIMAVMGLMLGLEKGFSALMVAFWMGALIMVPIVGYARHHKKFRDPEIPFGPFLLFALYITGITGFNIFSFITRVVQ